MQPPSVTYAPSPPQPIPAPWQSPAPATAVLPAVPPPRLVPRSVPALVDEGVRAVRRDLGLFAAAAAFTVIPTHLVSAFVSTLFTPFDPFEPATYARVSAHAVSTNMTATTLIAVLAGLLTLAIGTLGTGALITLAGLRTLNQPCTLGIAYAHARGHYWPLLGQSLLASVAVGAVAVCTLFVGTPFALFLYVAWQLAPQSVVLEGQGMIRAMKRSFRLTRGAWWRLVALLIVLGILRLFTAAVPGGLALLISEFTASKDLLGGVGVALLAIVASLVDMVMVPVTVVVMTLFFTDLRLRREGFDIDLLLQRGMAERMAVAS